MQNVPKVGLPLTMTWFKQPLLGWSPLAQALKVKPHYLAEHIASKDYAIQSLHFYQAN